MEFVSEVQMNGELKRDMTDYHRYGPNLQAFIDVGQQGAIDVGDSGVEILEEDKLVCEWHCFSNSKTSLRVFHLESKSEIARRVVLWRTTAACFIPGSECIAVFGSARMGLYHWKTLDHLAEMEIFYATGEDNILELHSPRFVAGCLFAYMHDYNSEGEDHEMPSTVIMFRFNKQQLMDLSNPNALDLHTLAEYRGIPNDDDDGDVLQDFDVSSNGELVLFVKTRRDAQEDLEDLVYHWVNVWMATEGVTGTVSTTLYSQRFTNRVFSQVRLIPGQIPQAIVALSNPREFAVLNLFSHQTIRLFQPAIIDARPARQWNWDIKDTNIIEVLDAYPADSEDITTICVWNYENNAMVVQASFSYKDTALPTPLAVSPTGQFIVLCPENLIIMERTDTLAARWAHIHVGPSSKRRKISPLLQKQSAFEKAEPKEKRESKDEDDDDDN